MLRSPTIPQQVCRALLAEPNKLRLVLWAVAKAAVFVLVVGRIGSTVCCNLLFFFMLVDMIMKEISVCHNAVRRIKAD